MWIHTTLASSTWTCMVMLWLSKGDGQVQHPLSLQTRVAEGSGREYGGRANHRAIGWGGEPHQRARRMEQEQ